MRGRYNVNSQIQFKTLILRSILCEYSDVYIFVSGTIKVAALASGGRNSVILLEVKNCASFTNFMSEIHNTQIDNGNR